MAELSSEDMEAVSDIKEALQLMSEQLRLGREMSDDIRSTYDTIAGNTEFLRRYVEQIDKLKENISVAASEMVAEEIAQLGKSYEVMQEDYNDRMGRMQKLVILSITVNTFFLIAVLVDFFLYPH